jgi:hypothetical protein
LLQRPDPSASLDGLPIHFYFGSEDETVPASHAALYEKVFPDAAVHRLPACDHQFTGRTPLVAKDVLALEDA